MDTDTEGKVVGLWLCVGHREPMSPAGTVRMIEGHGIEGDRHAGRGNNNARQVLLMDRETLADFGLAAGEVRENVTTSGLDLSELQRGRRLSVGEVELEVTGECTPCSRLEEISPGLQERSEGRRGILAAVKRSGSVSVGDGVRVLEEAAAS